MAFRKTIRAKALDLFKTIGCKSRVIATRHHALHHQMFEAVNGANIFECGHGAAQLIGLDIGKLRRHDGQFHGLFLKQRHTHSAAQNLAQFIRRPVLWRW